MAEAGHDLATPEAAYRAALSAGRLTFQQCACGNAWLPPRSECPKCLSPDFAWREAGGEATLVSWVVYHRAYDDAFAVRLPYTVAIVELAEGPRLITNIVDAGNPEALVIDQKLALRIGDSGGVAIPQFSPAIGELPT